MNATPQEITSSMAWTGSGYIDMLKPDPAVIDLNDIGVGLSREPRYGGSATVVTWTVGQHSLLVDKMAEDDGVDDPVVRRCILMHDAPEYMLRDMLAPMKRHCPEYREIEAVWWAAIAQRFDLPVEMPPEVKHYDTLASATEKRVLISPAAGAWPGLPEAREFPMRLITLDERAVFHEFMHRAHCLGLGAQTPGPLGRA